MSKKELLDGNQAAAWAVKLANVQSFPCFPITPQTEIIETIAKWKADGKLKNLVFNELESEHSVISAALGSQMTGARTFTATSSQGIMLMHEILPIISGTRMPLVMVNVSRALSAPITLWPDHNDFLAMRDAGWIMFCCETNQEVLDTIIMAYKIAENKKVMLPVLINMDGFIHSYTRTEVEIPDQKKVSKFLMKTKQKNRLDVKKPMTLGGAVLEEEYIKYRSQLHSAHLEAINVIKNVQKKWKDKFKRRYYVVEEYGMKNAKAALVIMGSYSTIAKSAVDNLKSKGINVGIVRLRLIRPFPSDEIRSALGHVNEIGVFDQNLSPGLGGILYSEVKACLKKNKNVSSFIGGLGGKPVSEKDFEEIFKTLLREKKEMRKWVM